MSIRHREIELEFPSDARFHIKQIVAADVVVGAEHRPDLNAAPKIDGARPQNLLR
jgi:hypothetical protein